MNRRLPPPYKFGSSNHLHLPFFCIVVPLSHPLPPHPVARSPPASTTTKTEKTTPTRAQGEHSEAFFLPYLWEVVLSRTPDLNWSPARVRVFSSPSSSSKVSTTAEAHAANDPSPPAAEASAAGGPVRGSSPAAGGGMGGRTPQQGADASGGGAWAGASSPAEEGEEVPFLPPAVPKLTTQPTSAVLRGWWGWGRGGGGAGGHPRRRGRRRGSGVR